LVNEGIADPKKAERPPVKAGERGGSVRAELVVDCRNRHGEGILWDAAAGLVRWTDIHGRALWSHDPATDATHRHDLPARLCAFAPRAGGNGLIAAFADRVSLYDPATGAEQVLAYYAPGRTGLRLNDGRTDRQGRFVVGGMNEATGAADATVIRVNQDLTVETLFGGVACANSTCFSPDGATMYFADTPEGTIRAYPYDGATGALGMPRLHADMTGEPGLPDGSCVDAEGGVWNAEWEGRRVIRIAPGGRIDRVVEVPVWKPTCCAFGGADLGTLFITTSRLMSPDEVLRDEPLSGGLFALRPGIGGVADAPFAG
jgi:L-arabinonolactonase